MQKIPGMVKWPRYAGRILLLILLPFAVGLWVLPHTQYVDGPAIGTPQAESGQGPDGAVSYAFMHDAPAPASALGTLFPLASYADFAPLVSHERLQLCFADTGSRFVLADGSWVPAPVEWNVTVNDRIGVLVGPLGSNCTPLPEGRPASYQWKANLAPAVALAGVNGTLTFQPRTQTYARVRMDWGLLQGLAMIPVFYLLVWYPAAGIWRKLQEGMGAQ